MSKILFLVEGEKTEKKVIRSIERNFFDKNNNTEFECFVLPFKSNIYNLAKILEEDPDVDIVEYIKEQNESDEQLENIQLDNISEIYLLFDFDGHDKHNDHNQKIEKIQTMLNVFDNETENGKLIISYPMVEAIQDLCDDTEKLKIKELYQLVLTNNAENKENTYSLPNIVVPSWLNINYKSKVGNSNFQQYTKYTIKTWQKLIEYHRRKLSFLYENEEIIEYTQQEIFTKQLELIQDIEHIWVLSAYPQFLIDYFPPIILQNKLLQEQNIET
ncbi:MAG: hypothetical protein ACRDD4_04205 [Culicoidibacterales bacterium]